MGHQCKNSFIIGFADSMLSGDDSYIKDFLSIYLEYAIPKKYSMTFFVEKDMEIYYKKLKENQCDIPILVFNPVIIGIKEVWGVSNGPAGLFRKTVYFHFKLRQRV
jgi:hypothetical protein